MDEAPEYNQNSRNLDQMMKSGEAFSFFSAFEKSKAYESDESGTKKKYIEFIGSSDSEDLVGDVMELTALKEMEQTAPGTIMLRDHHRSTDKVFGWVTEAKLQQDTGKYIIIFKAEVDEEDTANIRIWKNIQLGRKLGASVTVRVLSKVDNPRRAGGLIIKSVHLLEISIVTIPCNQDAWSLAATASKALKIMERSKTDSAVPETIVPNDPAPAEINSIKEEENMSNKNQTAGTAAGDNAAETENTESELVQDPAATGVAEVPAEESKTFLSRALAAQKAFEDRKKAAEETKVAPKVSDVVTKGLFVDEQAKRQPTLWDLFDILCSVKWQLMDRKWAMEWSDITDDYDYVGEYKIASQEFAEAAVKSFAYYGGFIYQGDEVSGAAAETELEVDEVVIENALDLQKSFEVFAALYEKAPEENKPTLKSIGDEIVTLIEKAGISLGREAAPAAEITDDVVRKSQIFLDTEERAKTAEAKVEELQQTLDVATAGLEFAVEATEQVLGQPLQLDNKN